MGLMTGKDFTFTFYFVTLFSTLHVETRKLGYNYVKSCFDTLHSYERRTDDRRTDGQTDGRQTTRGVDPYGTGGTCPPNIWTGGHYHECPPQYF